MATFETECKNKKVHQQKLMHEKCTTLFVVTQILSHSDKYAKIEPAFLPEIAIKIHTYPMRDIENLCDRYIISYISLSVNR